MEKCSSRRDCDGMGQALGIGDNVAFDAGYLFAGIITFVAGATGILDALRIKNAETCLGVAPLLAAGRANLIFLTPAPAGCYRLRMIGSILKIMMDRTPFREITRQHPPLATTH
jgi:hypothetical protein